MITVKVKKLHPDAVIPRYATAGSAGFDLVAVEDVVIAPGETKKVPLGLAFEIPDGYVMYVCMRSGIALKTKLRQSNGIGVIDSDYRGEVAMLFDNTFPVEYRLRYDDEVFGQYIAPDMGHVFTVDGDDCLDFEYGKYMHGTYLIRKGDRIAQGIIAKVPQATFEEVDELSETERGTGGFGSTGVVG